MPAKPMETPILDLTELKSIADGDESFVLEVLQEYLTVAPTLVSELEHAILREDSLAVQSSAHDLKGSSKTVGAIRLASLASSIETAARLEQWDQAVALNANANQTWMSTQDAIQKVA